MFLATHTRSPELLLCGGALTSILGAVYIHVIPQKTRLKKDAALGIVLSVFFGWGLVVMTRIAQHGISGQSIVNKFLFGSAATLLLHDVIRISIVTVITLATMLLFWKELVMFTFDATLCHMLGYKKIYLECILTGLLTLTIVIGLQTVGVVLMSSLLIGPAVAASLWTRNLRTMLILAAACGGISCASGALISSSIHHLPTGPTIVVITNSIALLSIIGTARLPSKEHTS